jgi:hypothetical protein
MRGTNLYLAIALETRTAWFVGGRGNIAAAVAVAFNI